MTFGPQWTVPDPPPSGDRPIRGRMVAAGMGIAALGQLLAIGLGVGVTFLLATVGDGSSAIVGLYLEVAFQLILFIACLTGGIVWITRRDRGIGVGLIVGWAVSVLVFPAVGIGVCIAIVSAYSGGG